MPLLKKSGMALILVGLAFFALRIGGLLAFIGGALQILLIFGLPAIGAFLIFAARYLYRPSGIDNDHIYRHSLSRRGLIAWSLGLVLTGFYVIIYMGNDIRISVAKEGVLALDRRGEIIEMKGGLFTDNLKDVCPDCVGAGEASVNYSSILPYELGLHEKIGLFLEKGSTMPKQELSFGWDYEYKADIHPRPYGAILHLRRADTLHHLFNRNVYSLLDPLAYSLSGRPASNWFFYGSLYTFAILIFGARMLMKYRHNRYQILRTLSVMFFQLGFAYILPNLLKLFHQPEYYFSYFWPLKPEYLNPQVWLQAYGPGVYFLGFGVIMTFVGTPVLTYFFGKRWYCSWVCGCGGLAETMGDPFRQLSNKSLSAWKIERWFVHSVLGVISLITLLLWVNSVGSGSVFGAYSYDLQKAYGFFIGAIFSGVIGVGFYPLMGSRVWCRFGCPMAAILGLIQKWFSRFRITTNGGQCISCGNCSTYCEMGIDVRWYAQRGQNIIRSSCVGCGVCAAVCPRGVLKLENKVVAGRYNGPDPSLMR